MGFLDIELPEALQYQSSFGSGFQVQVQSNATGHEQVTLRSSQARHRYSLIKQFLSPEEAMEMKRFVYATQGAFSYFRVKDWGDYTSAANGVDAPSETDQAIGTGDGTTTQFQLLKSYSTNGATTYDRIIELPVVDTVSIAVDNSVEPPANYTVNYTTGVVTFSTAPAVGVTVSAGFEFRVQVRFAETSGTLLNSVARAHQVWDIQTFDLIEKVSDGEWADRWWSGGATDWGNLTADVTLSFRNGLLNILNPTTSGLSVFFPTPGFAPGGPNMFTLVNQSSTNAIAMRDDAGALIANLTADTQVGIGLYTDGSGNRVWVALST